MRYSLSNMCTYTKTYSNSSQAQLAAKLNRSERAKGWQQTWDVWVAYDAGDEGEQVQQAPRTSTLIYVG